MFGIFEVFADTIVICTLTAMVILCSGTTVNYGTAAGAELTISGFTTTYGGWAPSLPPWPCAALLFHHHRLGPVWFPVPGVPVPQR